MSQDRLKELSDGRFGGRLNRDRNFPSHEEVEDMANELLSLREVVQRSGLFDPYFAWTKKKQREQCRRGFTRSSLSTSVHGV